MMKKKMIMMMMMIMITMMMIMMMVIVMNMIVNRTYFFKEICPFNYVNDISLGTVCGRYCLLTKGGT